MSEGLWYGEDDDEGHDDPGAPPTGHMHSMQGMPADAQAMGLDRNVPEGAWLAFAGSLSASKPSHRVVAWVLLVMIVVTFLLTLHAELF
jgi:hypothetical protein